MATRGIYIFKDALGEYRVYKHWDNYPEGAYDFIKAALQHAWDLPRFEADEFAASFIRANKNDAGDVRLVPHGATNMGQEYEYTITCPNATMFGKGEAELIIEFDDREDNGKRVHFKGTLRDMREYIAKKDKA